MGIESTTLCLRDHKSSHWATTACIYFCNPMFLLQSGANIEAEKRVVVRYTSGGARRVPPVESTLVAY